MTLTTGWLERQTISTNIGSHQMISDNCKHLKLAFCPSLWPSGIGSRLGRNRLWVRFLAVSDIYPMFIEPTITWVPSGFSEYIWLDTKIVLKKKKNYQEWHPLFCDQLFVRIWPELLTKFKLEALCILGERVRSALYCESIQNWLNKFNENKVWKNSRRLREHIQMVNRCEQFSGRFIICWKSRTNIWYSPAKTS